MQVSTDGGATWRFARLLDAGENASPYAWRQWELQWVIREPGTYTLMARATDTSGTAQPFAYDLGQERLRRQPSAAGHRQGRLSVLALAVDVGDAG